MSTCGVCKHWTKPVHTSRIVSGFRLCGVAVDIATQPQQVWLAKATHRPPSALCQFKPSRWERVTLPQEAA